MPTPPNWLERLAHATEYRELQILFSEIATEARTTDDPEAVAALIDEAVLRIERERHRDEDELRAFEEEYEAFKEKKSGVVGWLKRHIPFTETRRQAKEHQAALDDQEAELLADNLVIARAQMLKEGLLPAADRRLGHEAAQWRTWLTERDAVARLLAYADTAKELGRELAQSREFVRQVGTDIDAFSRARFANEEDRRRQKDDVTDARSELATCQAEIDDEEALRTRCVTRLRELVTAELAEHDGAFERLTGRVSQLQVATERAEQLEQNLETLHTHLAAARDLAERIEALPGRREEISRTVAKLERAVDDAERARLRASSNLAEHDARDQEADDRSTQAQAEVHAAKSLWDAAVVDPGMAEMPPETTADATSPEAMAHARAEKALEAARAAQRVARAARDNAASELAKAKGAAAAAQAERTKRRDERDGLEREARRLGGELDEALDAARPLLGGLPREVGDILPRRRFTVEGMGERSHRELRDASERCDGILQSTQRERTSLQEDLEERRRERDEALAARCRELLGDELGAEVCP